MIKKGSSFMRRICLLLTTIFLLSGCTTAKSTPDTELPVASVAQTAVMETQIIPVTEETTQPTESDLPWSSDVRWYGTYYFEKRPNPDPNIVEGVVRFNSLLRNEGRETLTIVSAHADYYLGTTIVAQEDYDSNRLLDFLPHPRVGNLKIEYGETKVFQLYSTEQETGSYDRVIITYTICDLNDNEATQTFHFAVNEEDITPYSTSDRTDWSPAAWSEERWDFYLLPQNNTNSTLAFVGMYNTAFENGLPMGSDFFDKSHVSPQALKDIQTLLPGEMAYYQTGITHQFNTSDERELTMVYKDPSGELYLQTFRFALDEEHAVPGAVSIYRSIYAEKGVQLLDTPNQLRQELGMPHYSRQEIQKMIDDGLSLEELAEKLSTIYDVQQFFLEAGLEFKGGDIKQHIGGTLWHFNDSPEIVLQQNYGNCGSGSNLINYLLQGDYDEQGYFCWSGTRTGHIFNYFRSGDRYYIFDWANKVQDCFAVFVADSLEVFSDAYIRANHAVNSVNRDQHILLLYAYPYEGNHRPLGDGSAKTPMGVPLMSKLSAELENTVNLLYVEEEQYAPTFEEAPPISQWPKDSR